MRPIWKGSISFGLVNIPIRLYSASHERELKFSLLHKKDLSEIRYAKICKHEEKEVPYEDIVKGYEKEDGTVVVLTEEDFKKADLEKSKAIEIFDFTLEDEIDPIYFDKPYFLEPEKGAAHAYALLREALIKSQKVAIAKYTFKNHQHLGVIKPYEGVLVLNQMRYHDAIVRHQDLNIPKTEKMPANEMELALELIEKLTKPFHPEKYSDPYVDDLKEIIQRKEKGAKFKTKAAPGKKSAKVEDIMSYLKASLEGKSKTQRKQKSTTKSIKKQRKVSPKKVG